MTGSLVWRGGTPIGGHGNSRSYSSTAEIPLQLPILALELARDIPSSLRPSVNDYDDRILLPPAPLTPSFARLSLSKAPLRGEGVVEGQEG